MSITFTTTVHFNSSKEKVFDGLTNLDGARQGVKSFISIEKIKGTKIEPGAVWRETHKMFGQKATEEFEVTSIVPYKEIKLRVDGTKGTSKKGEYLFQYILQEKDGGTDVTMNGEMVGLKGIGAFFGKLFVGVFKKGCSKHLWILKERLDSGKL